MKSYKVLAETLRFGKKCFQKGDTFSSKDMPRGMIAALISGKIIEEVISESKKGKTKKVQDA
ncbi:MAG: hypothetical protein HRU26_05040 [Psychroserpens sp.]|nr:hypothetical protein [Psychroserpens sp.]